MANLCDYETGNTIRPATKKEQHASTEAARTDGGAGVIEVDGRSCYVEETRPKVGDHVLIDDDVGTVISVRQDGMYEIAWDGSAQRSTMTLDETDIISQEQYLKARKERGL